LVKEFSLTLDIKLNQISSPSVKKTAIEFLRFVTFIPLPFIAGNLVAVLIGIVGGFPELIFGIDLNNFGFKFLTTAAGWTTIYGLSIYLKPSVLSKKGFLLTWFGIVGISIANSLTIIKEVDLYPEVYWWRPVIEIIVPLSVGYLMLRNGFLEKAKKFSNWNDDELKITFPFSSVISRFLIILKDFFGYYHWSKNKPVDEDIVDALNRKDAFNILEGEEFLFTSPSVRFHSLIVSNMGILCITNKRLIFLAGRWQPNIQSAGIPSISFVDISSIKIFREDNKNWRYPYKTVLLKARFIDGDDPSNYYVYSNRKERISLRKDQKNLKFFKEALENLGLKLGDPILNSEEPSPPSK